MRIIDAHAHVFERLTGFGCHGELRPLGKGWGRWGTGEKIRIIPENYGDEAFLPETLLEIMDQNNVKMAVLLQGNLYGFHNEFVHEVQQKYPQRFIGSGTLDPFCADAEKIISRLTGELGFRILKFELSSGGGLAGYHGDLKIDGPEMELIWRHATEHKITLVIDLGSYGMPSFQVEALGKTAQRYPELKIVLAHLLAPTGDNFPAWLDAVQILHQENIWFDITALPWNIREAYPFLKAVSYLTEAKQVLGAGRLLWGTDAPILLTIATYQQLLQFVIDSKVFTGTELEQVMGGNAATVYNI